MVSVIITAFAEKETIAKAVESLLAQISSSDELLVVAPDKETLNAAQAVSSRVEVYADKGRGKPAAVNLGLAKAKGEVVVLTDGDVWASRDSLKFLLTELEKEKTGLVSGKPVSLNDRNSILGFWAYCLTEVAHLLRIKRESRGEYFDASGYLLAAKKNLLPILPEKILADDVYFSQKVYQQGLKIAYAPKAEVYVKYPTSFRDWIKQKVRSVGGAGQGGVEDGPIMRGFQNESKGFAYFLKYPKNPQEWIWLGLLFLARAYLWGVILIKQRIFKVYSWPRVESTK